MSVLSVRMGLPCLLAALALWPAAAGQEPKKPGPIAVVKTWKELYAQPPIDLGGGVKVRLGLSAEKSPQWSGVLLYCLTEGYTPALRGSGREPLGPVFVALSFGEALRAGDHSSWSLGEKPGGWPKGAYLYAQALHLNRVGAYRVQVENAKGRALAEATVEGTREPFHPWTPCFTIAAPKMPDRERAAGIVLPCWGGYGPVAFAEQGKPPPGELPTFLPHRPKPGFKIALDGSEVVIRSDTDFTVSRPDCHFIARWWVNDTPFVPRQLAEFPGSKGYGAVLEGKEERVPLHFTPSLVGAKAGDRIGLQLLYCPEMWCWCGQSSRIGGRDAPWLTNRIDFIAKEMKAK